MAVVPTRHKSVVVHYMFNPYLADMTNADLTIYLDPDLKASAQVGRHSFISLMVSVVQDAGYTVSFRTNTYDERHAAKTCPNLTLSHMEPPINKHGLTFRRVYSYPF